jgi:hypothetical protein
MVKDAGINFTPRTDFADAGALLSFLELTQFDDPGTIRTEVMFNSTRAS